jgi:hypothetical protein
MLFSSALPSSSTGPPSLEVITGRVDDLWVDTQGKYIAVDDKSMSKDTEVTLEELFGEKVNAT